MARPRPRGSARSAAPQFTAATRLSPPRRTRRSSNRPPSFGKGKRGMTTCAATDRRRPRHNELRPYAATGRTECSAPCSTRDERQAWTRNRGFEVSAGSAPTWTASTRRVGPRERRARERPASPGCTEPGRVEAQSSARKHQPYSFVVSVLSFVPMDWT